jgi:hypothetical protein
MGLDQDLFGRDVDLGDHVHDLDHVRPDCRDDHAVGIGVRADPPPLLALRINAEQALKKGEEIPGALHRNLSCSSFRCTDGTGTPYDRGRPLRCSDRDCRAGGDNVPFHFNLAGRHKLQETVLDRHHAGDERLRLQFLLLQNLLPSGQFVINLLPHQVVLLAHHHDDVVLLHLGQAPDLEDGIERLIPRHVLEVEGHRSLDLIPGDDADLPLLGQESEDRLDIGVLDIQEDPGAVIGLPGLPIWNFGRFRLGHRRRLGCRRRLGRRFLRRGDGRQGSHIKIDHDVRPFLADVVRDLLLQLDRG